MDPIALRVLLIIADAFKQVRKQSFDIFLADLAVSGRDGIRGLQHLITIVKEAPVVEAQALEAVR